MVLIDQYVVGDMGEIGVWLMDCFMLVVVVVGENVQEGVMGQVVGYVVFLGVELVGQLVVQLGMVFMVECGDVVVVCGQVGIWCIYWRCIYWNSQLDLIVNENYYY